MTIQTIIDTYNYSTATGCKLTTKAVDELYEAILMHMDMGVVPEIDPSKGNMGTLYVKAATEIPEGFMTFTGFRPTTKILYQNYSELELLRILSLIKPGATQFALLYETTKERIRTTCFGNFCGTGECFEISVIALRFIATVFPEEKLWIDRYVSQIARTILEEDRRISKRTLLMFCQVLSELRREKDGEIIDCLLSYLGDKHLHNKSNITSAINDCILYSSLRRAA